MNEEEFNSKFRKAIEEARKELMKIENNVEIGKFLWDLREYCLSRGADLEEANYFIACLCELEVMP